MNTLFSRHIPFLYYETMPRSSNKLGQQSVRILIHEHDVDDVVPIIGGDESNNNELGDKYEDKYQDTISKNMEDDTRKYYRRRIICIANYWEIYCPVYYSTGVRIEVVLTKG